MISEVWYLRDRSWAFQRVGNFYNLYDANGDFNAEFRSFDAMMEYIEMNKILIRALEKHKK